MIYRATLLAAALVLSATAAHAQSSGREIQPYAAKQIQPYKAKEIQPYTANDVKRQQSRKIQPYRSHEVKPLTRADQDRMNHNPNFEAEVKRRTEAYNRNSNGLTETQRRQRQQQIDEINAAERRSVTPR